MLPIDYRAKIGEKAVWIWETQGRTLILDVELLDFRISFGDYQYRVKPLCGELSGRDWVSLASIQLKNS